MRSPLPDYRARDWSSFHAGDDYEVDWPGFREAFRIERMKEGDTAILRQAMTFCLLSIVVLSAMWFLSGSGS